MEKEFSQAEEYNQQGRTLIRVHICIKNNYLKYNSSQRWRKK